MEEKLEEIIVEVKKYLVKADADKIRRAYDFGRQVHAGQYRFSGDPFLLHALEAAKILIRIRPDVDAICACILHDTVEDDRTQRGKKLLKEIEEKFGRDVSVIVDGVSKLGRIKYRGEEREVESLRKMFVAMANDVRVILVRLADRLHNMNTLQHHPKVEKRARIAKETLEIYVPVAARLGLYGFKHSLEDKCFEFLYPKEFERIKGEVKAEKVYVEKQIKKGVGQLSKFLRKNGINAEVRGRLKNLYGIYRKMRKKGLQEVGQVSDVFALRVLVDDIEQCYAVLGLIHNRWTPVPGRFKDYIAKKKVNGYQSLHTDVVGLLDKPTEIQIRTYQMHKVAQFGVAAHWHYKEASSNIPLRDEDKQWLEGILDRHKKSKESEDFLHQLKLGFFEDEIFVMTPKGEVKILPEGATPVDFAYQVHTDVGHCIRGAKVDGKIVPLDYRLKNGEVVEILTKKHPSPSEYWLQFVKTASAREKIRAWLSSQDKDKFVRRGYEALNELLLKEGIGELDANLNLLKEVGGKRLTMEERRDLLERVGNGSVSAGNLLRQIFPNKRLGEVRAKKRAKKKVQKDAKKKNVGVVVGGEKGLGVKMAACCKPKPWQGIFGYVTKTGKITVHRKDCPIGHTLDEERKMPAHWEGEKEGERVYRVEMKVEYHAGLLGDLLHYFYDKGIEIISLQSYKQEGVVVLWVDFVVYDEEEVEGVRGFLEGLDLVKEMTLGEIVGA